MIGNILKRKNKLRKTENTVETRLQTSSPIVRHHSSQSGFSLLELLIVMFIMVILVSIALPQYNTTVLYAKETVLKDSLQKMRSQIDQYGADKGKLPQSLDELVVAGYIREIPIDPITNDTDWETFADESANSKDGGSGIKDVKSASHETSSDGKPYNEF